MKFYNTLTRTKEDFKPIIPGQVGIYACGPTVYSFAHLGNLRSWLFEDLLRRTLEYNGFKVKHVMNITDVGHLNSNADSGEDKMELSAQKSNKTAWEIAEYYTQAFLKDLKQLNILLPEVMPKATDHISEQIELIKKLEEKGYTYRISDGIYFDVAKFSQYGRLSRQKLEDKEAGARVELNTEKRNPADFALWKFSNSNVKRQMEWESPWAEKGFPGWHIECSAMSTKYLGQPFDIHCGAIDLIPVHHENEIAQSEAAFDKPLANFWMHGEFMMVEGRRMGKSEGNAFLIDNLIEEGFDPLAFRYLCLNTHYRMQFNFTWEALGGAQKALERLREQINQLKSTALYDENDLGQAQNKGQIIESASADFQKAINDDLNIPLALGVVWTMIRSEAKSEDRLVTLLEFDKVLGLDLAIRKVEKFEIPKDVRDLVEAREKARKEKNFQKADELRSEIQKKGFQLEDTSQGQNIKKI